MTFFVKISPNFQRNLFYNTVGMKYVRFWLIAALTILICLFSLFPALPVFAEDTVLHYAYVKEGVEAYLCAEKDLKTALFAIPETYCVELLQSDGEWYYCRYAKDEGEYREKRGYCLKKDLTPYSEPLENEYLNFTFTVKFSAEQGAAQIPPFEIELTAAFYGNCRIVASPLSYVYCNGAFGYVARTVTEYPRNELPQPVISDDVTEPKSNATLIAAIVITVVAVIAVAALYFVGKRPKLPPKSET